MLSILDEGNAHSRLEQRIYNSADLDEIARGTFLFSDSPRLPARWWRAFNRVWIDRDKQTMKATWQVQRDLPLFALHFPGQPVLPGVFALDQLLQLSGLYLGCTGVRGFGMAMGGGEFEFRGMITPESKVVTYTLEVERVLTAKIQSKIWTNGQWEVDGKHGGSAKQLCVKVVHSKT